MRVVLLTETYAPYINGVATHIKVLKDGLESLGHEVMVVTADPKVKKHTLKDGVLRCPSREMKRLYGFGLASPVSATRLKIIRSFNPDIIHIHQEFGVGLFGYMTAKKLHKPLVYTMHTMYDEYLYYIAPKPLIPTAKRMSRRYVRMLAKRAAALTGPSKKVSDYFKDAGVNKFVNVIPNSVEISEFDRTKVPPETITALREQLGIPAGRRIGCFVGRQGREKGIDVLLQWWSDTITEQDNLHVVIIGDGPDREAFMQLAKDLHVDSMFTFTGAIPHNDLPPYYAMCDFYITASVTEMYSISMLEGMAAGLAVFQRYDEANAGQITEGVNGFIYDDAASMAKKLHAFRALSDDELELLKRSVVDSVKNSGAADLANYMVAIYENSFHELQH